jgi:hypothetical protein
MRDLDYGRYDTEGHRDERLSETIERHAVVTKKLADELGEKVVEIETRHKFLRGLQELEADHAIPIKTLEKRLTLLTSINERQRFIPDAANLPNEKLKERVELIETILRLEPDQANRPSLRALKDRTRALTEWVQASRAEAIEKAENKWREAHANDIPVKGRRDQSNGADTAADHFFDPAE